jgi:hypothetical protein
VKRARQTIGVAVFPGDSLDGLRVAYLGRAGGYDWVKALESRDDIQAGDEFVWALANVRPQLELFAS